MKGVMTMAKSKGKKFVGPKSLCTCGHTGDGENSQHDTFGGYAPGVGRCLVNGCGCQRFTWAGWLKKYENFLAAGKEQK